MPSGITNRQPAYAPKLKVRRGSLPLSIARARPAMAVISIWVAQDYFFAVSQPRISPSGYLAVWTLAYH